MISLRKSRIVSLAVSVAVVSALVLAGASPAAAARTSSPTTPTNFRADIGTSSVTVTWDPSRSRADVTIYFVQLDGQWFFTEEPSITFFLARDRTYRMQVQAQDASFRRSDWSEPFSFTTPVDFPVTTPGNVRVSEAPGSLTVQWDQSSSDAGVLDYTATMRGGSGGAVAARTPGTTVTFDLPPGGEVEVTVQARDQAYRLSDGSAPVGAIVPPADEWAPPGTPGNLRAVFDSSDRVERLEWDAGGGGGGVVTYHVKLDGDEIESTRLLELELFDFAACPDGARNPLEFSVSASSNGFESADSEPVVLCFD
jgi:hypothetical protein